MIGDILTSLFGESYAWQDIVIAVVSILFGFILLPQLKDVWHGKSKLNLFTASLTTIGLYVLAITFFTMHFWISFFAELFSGTIWLLLFVFSLKNFRKRK
ncbi:MAG: hypothetical protein AYK22_01875 [Thermoplasmatales archaeon SG8-52-3]|nr:MAG: hypothetical protein AYK22_01875 [Thermoplasmatales archaeon SG8-52-3]